MKEFLFRQRHFNQTPEVRASSLSWPLSSSSQPRSSGSYSSWRITYIHSFIRSQAFNRAGPLLQAEEMWCCGRAAGGFWAGGSGVSPRLGLASCSGRSMSRVPTQNRGEGWGSWDECSPFTHHAAEHQGRGRRWWWWDASPRPPPPSPPIPVLTPRSSTSAGLSSLYA